MNISPGADSSSNHSPLDPAQSRLDQEQIAIDTGRNAKLTRGEGIVWPHCDRTIDVAEVGGKGAGLLELYRLKAVVPPFFIVSTAHYRDFLAANDLMPCIMRLQEESDCLIAAQTRGAGQDVIRLEESVARLSYEIQLGIVQGRMPDNSRATIAQACGALQEQIGHAAVMIARSSATSEDLTKSAAAGQYHSERPIFDADGLIVGVKKVWASMFCLKAVQHRNMLRRDALAAGRADLADGYAHCRAEMAVPVQKMVPAGASGVAFNYDIRHQSPGILIEATEGLAEELVTGSVTPDSWLFDAAGRVLLEKHFVPRSTKVAFVANGGLPEVEVQRIELPDRGRPALSDARAQEIAEEVSRIGALRKGLIDMEFAVDGIPYFLQLRPQTAVPGRSEIAFTVVGIDPKEPARNAARSIHLGGETASLGAVAGRLLIIAAIDTTYPEHDNLPLAYRYLEPGDILVTVTTNIGWTPLFDKLGGVITERGGVTSHSAIIAREKDKPAVVGAWQIVRTLKTLFGGRPDVQKEHNGDVWIVPAATLDAINRTLFDRTVPTVKMPLHEVLDANVPEQNQDYYYKRTEFAHFKDDKGREWTGKPEYAMSPLQFDLYYRAWEKALQQLGLHADQMPLMVSVATPVPKESRERVIGHIRTNTKELSGPNDYRVVAFPTKQLADLGDQIRMRGIPAGRNKSEAQVLDELMAYNEARKEAFKKFVDFCDSITEGADPCAVDWRQLFENYSEIISFAHVRAAFRRRVVGPLRAAVIEKLPPDLRRYVEKVLVDISSGLFTETTHKRDLEYRQLLFELHSIPDLKSRVMQADADTARSYLQQAFPDLFGRIAAHAANYKIERIQTDHIENEPPVSRLLELLAKDLRNFDGSPPTPDLFTRTPEGYAHELDRIRTMLEKKAPDFDFDSFKAVMRLSRDTAALTDNERHIQHRYQYKMYLWLREAEKRLKRAGLMPAHSSILSLERDTLLDKLRQYRSRSSE